VHGAAQSCYSATRRARCKRICSWKCNFVIEVDGEVASVRAYDIPVFVIDDKTEAVAADFHRYGARRAEDGWRFDRLEITPVALTEPAESRYPGRMLAFMRKKLAGSDFAFSAVSRVHCWSV
jgi:hypothetical protein